MITKSKRAVRTVFYVPLTSPEGERFLFLVRKYLNKASFKLRAVGRNEDRKGVSDTTGKNHGSLRQRIPIQNSTYCALYLDSKNEISVPLERLRWYETELDRKGMRIRCLEAAHTIENEQITELRRSLDTERMRVSVGSHEIIEARKELKLTKDYLTSYKQLADARLHELQALKSRSIWAALAAWWRAL